MATTTTFTTAILIFINLWLVALVSFAVIASAIILYILGAADSSIGPSIATSLICSASSFVYLILQCINVSQIRHQSWRKSWLSSTCVQLPRMLIVLWMVTTTIGLVVVFRRPLCQSGDINADAAAWQAGVGCWMFRVLVASDAVMLALSFSLFCLLEINGRYVSVGLFRFEYTPKSQHRRRALIASTYSASVQTFTSPANVGSEDELQLMSEKGEFRAARSLSPSPTYHTFDSSTTTLWPGSTPHNQSRTHGLSLLEPPIPLDLTLSGSLPFRRSTGMTTSDTPYDTNSTIFSGSQLHLRPISDVPALPSTLQKKMKGLVHRDNHLTTLKDATKSTTPPSWPLGNDGNSQEDVSPSMTRPALHSVPVNVTTPQLPKSRFKSTCALPLEALTRTHSLLALASPATNQRHVANDSLHHAHLHQPSADQSQSTAHHRLSTTSLPEQPPPAWCPQNLKSAPLSADPAIKRLTELRSRSSVATRLSVNSRRMSLGAFEFGFPRKSRISTVNDSIPVKRTVRDMDVNLGAENLCEMPDTPTPMPRPATITTSRVNDGTVGTEPGAVRLGGKENSNSTPTDVDSNPTSKIRIDKIMNRGRAKSHVQTHSHSRSRSGVTNEHASKRQYQFSIMPPIAKTRDVPGLGIEGVGTGIVAGACGREGATDKGKGKEKSGIAGIGKKVVERGRYESLPK